jgi:SAM-dependent methyltransferase
MNDRSLQKGWHWTQSDLQSWQIPDGEVMRLLYELGPDKKKKIYDLGCGIGRHTHFFASKGYSVYASDISERAVQETKKWITAESLQADIIPCPMSKIPNPQNFFDLVIAFHVIYHGYRETVEQTIKEVFRVLKPGGLFFGTFNALDEFSLIGGDLVDRNTIIHRGGLEDGIPHLFVTRQDIIELLHDFQIEKIQYYEEYFPPAFSREGVKTHFRFWARKKS